MYTISKRFKLILILGMLFSLIIACDTKDVKTVDLTPTAPDSLNAVANDSAATISWGLSDKAENYVVYVSDSEFGIYKPHLTTNTLSAKVTNLTNDKPYWVKVVARNIHGKGGASVTVKVTPKKPLTKPIAPTIQSVILVDNTASVTWQPTPTADSYNLYYSIADGSYNLYKSTANTTMQITDIAPNTNYKFYLTAQNSIGASENSAVFEFKPKEPRIPAIYPASIVAYSGNNAVTLYWQMADDASSYAIYFSEDAEGIFLPVGSTTDNYFTTNNLLNDKTYYFKIGSVNYLGVSQLSPAVSSTPTSVITKLDRPKNVIATPGDAEILLEWDEVLNANGYNIYISTQEDTGYQKLSSTTDKFFNVSELTNDTVYYFIITASRYSLEGERSVLVASTPRQMLNAPLAPTALSILAGDTINYLEWAESAGATHYKIFRNTDNSDWISVATVTDTKYIDKSLINKTIYQYHVIALNKLMSSEASLIVSATPNAQTALPTIITGVTLQNIDDYFRLSWDKNYTANFYIVEIKKSSDTDFTDYKSTLDEFINIGGLESGVSYDFIITGIHGENRSEPSIKVSSTFFNLLVAPAKPTDLTATATDKTVTISWQAVDYAKSYIVYIAKKSDNVFNAVITTNVTSTVMNFLGNDEYLVKIVAVNIIGESPASETVSFKIKDADILPATPLHLTAVAGDSSATITWDAVPNATSYHIYKSLISDTGYDTYDNTTYTSITINNLTPDETYYFYVVAVNSLGMSEKSLVVSATPYIAIIPTVINGLQVTALDKQIFFTWLPTAYAKAYLVERATGDDSYAVVATVEMNRFYDFGLENGTVYKYKITPKNKYGSGTPLEFRATPSALLVAPTAPTYLKSTAGNAAVLLEYAQSPGATSYKIFQKTLNGTPTQVGVTINQLFTVSNLTNGVQYSFFVRAVNAAGDSVDSSTVIATPLATLSLPTPATNLAAAIVSGSSNIKLTWSNARNDTISLIYINDNVSFSENNFVLYAVASGEVYVFSGLAKGRTYKFKIRPVNLGKIGDFSSVVTIDFPAP